MGSASSHSALWSIGPRTAAGGRLAGTKPATPPSLCFWLWPQTFEYAPVRRARAALQLSAVIDDRLVVPADPLLVVRQLVTRTTHHPLLAVLEERDESGLLWVINFEVPLEVVEGPRAVFTLSAIGRTPVALPAPCLDPDLTNLGDELSTARLGIARTRRYLAAIGAGVAVATSTGALASAAAADSGSTATSPPASTSPASAPATTTATSGTSTTTTATSPPARTTNATGTPSAATTSSTSTLNSKPAGKSGAPKDSAARSTKHQPSSEQKTATPGSAVSHHRSTPTAAHRPAQLHKRHTASLGTALTITRPNSSAACRKVVLLVKPSKKTDAARPKHPKACLPACAPGQPAWHHGARTCVPPKPHGTHRAANKKHKHGLPGAQTHPLAQPHHDSLARHISGGEGLPTSHQIKAHLQHHGESHHGESTGPAAAGPAAPTIWNGGFNIDPFTAQQIERFTTVTASLDRPPGFLIPIYKAAGRRFHIPWQILAAINAIETDYGQNLSISPAGATGWMQFMPGTWSQFGFAADGSSRPNPYDPRDAIFSAARYLDASGGGRHIRRALFAYNHAWWYVDAVLWRAQLISDRAFGRWTREIGYALPLDLHYMTDLGRIDDGVDIEDAPDGVAVYSMTPGVVSAVASNPTGFGPDYPVVLATQGPLAGQYIYYGHVAASLVKVGQHVLAGQPIAVMGHTGNAAALGHGHIEIGFSDASGDPLNHGGTNAWTPSGDAMRRVLIALTDAFRVRALEAAARPHAPVLRPSPGTLGHMLEVASRLLRGAKL